MKTKEILERLRECKNRLLEVEHDIDRVDARIQEVALFGGEKSDNEPHKAFHAKRMMLADRLKLKREIQDLEMELTLNDYCK